MLQSMTYAETNDNSCIAGTSDKMQLVGDFLLAQKSDESFFSSVRNRMNSESPKMSSRQPIGKCEVQQELGVSIEQLKMRDQIKDLSTTVSRPNIKLSCIEEALTYRNSSSKMLCATGGGAKLAGSESPCYTKEMARYIQKVINEAANCFDEMYDAESDSPYFIGPINREILFKKILRESKFHPTTAYSGGVGIGQLTGPAIKAMTSESEGGPLITSIIDQGKNNPNGSCALFTEPLELKNLSREAKKDPCVLASFGSGFARNIMLSIGYHSFIRSKNKDMLINQLAIANVNKIPNDYQDTIKLLDYYAMAKYGPEYNDDKRYLDSLVRRHKGNIKKVLEELENPSPSNKIYVALLGSTTKTFMKDWQKKTQIERDANYCFSGIDE